MKQVRRILATFLLLGSLGALGFIAFYPLRLGGGQEAASASPRSREETTRLPPAAPPLLFADISADEARKANAAIPLSTEPLEPAPPFFLRSDVDNLAWNRAETDCLTAAIYYEAGYERLQGQRAVAQVILNRVRHPAFPNSICEVVFEGSERATGCQFTFTCDGSLARRPARQGWERARQVAVGALTGFVEPTVGMATHYHADYVTPYWAPSLAKVGRIDAHIFYRWKGGWGRRSAFTQALATSGAGNASSGWAGPGGLSITPYLPPMELPLSEEPSLSSPHRSGIIANVSGLADSPVVLEADEASGTLLADETAGTLVHDNP